MTQKTNPRNRCSWCNDSKLYQKYHDNEWGVPCYDDNELFRTLILETMQSGLSWHTILQKRKYYNKYIFCYSIKNLANFGKSNLDDFLQIDGIIKHKLKILSIFSNAQAFLDIQKEFGSFAKYIWQFTDNKIIFNQYSDISQIPTTTKLSDNITKDMKKRGFKFIGSITIYSYLQSIGIINDHVTNCWKYQKNNV